MASQRNVTGPRPRDVPGYRPVAAAGLVPQVPADPPSATVRPVAAHALRDVAVGAVALGAASLVVVAVGSEDGRLPWSTVGALLVVIAAGAALLWRLVRRWGRAQVAELQRATRQRPSRKAASGSQVVHDAGRTRWSGGTGPLCGCCVPTARSYHPRAGTATRPGCTRPRAILPGSSCGPATSGPATSRHTRPGQRPTRRPTDRPQPESIRVFERYAESPRASRSRRARIGWAVFFTLMVVPVLIAINAWVLKLLSLRQRISISRSQSLRLAGTAAPVMQASGAPGMGLDDRRPSDR